MDLQERLKLARRLGNAAAPSNAARGSAIAADAGNEHHGQRLAGSSAIGCKPVAGGLSIPNGVEDLIKIYEAIKGDDSAIALRLVRELMPKLAPAQISEQCSDHSLSTMLSNFDTGRSRRSSLSEIG